MTFWGACGAVRRGVFLAVGGFDESYRKACIEDIELGYRLKEAGHSIRLCKDLQVKHLKIWRAWSLVKADVLYRAVPWTRLLLRYRRMNNDLNLRFTSRLSVMMTFGLVATVAVLWWYPWLWLVAVVLASALVAVNAPLYLFFRRKRGIVFAAAVIPWHWFYYFYGGLAFACGLAGHVFSRRIGSGVRKRAIGCPVETERR